MTPRRVCIFSLTTPLVPTGRPYGPSVRPLPVIVAMRPVREYSFYRGRIGSCALGFAVPGSAVDGAHMIETPWYKGYSERTTSPIHQFRKGSSRSEGTQHIMLHHVAPCPEKFQYPAEMVL